MRRTILIFLLLISMARAGDVIINEIAWMGTGADTGDEWIELHNNSAASIDITGWALMAEDGSPEIALAGEILSYGYFLLERSTEETISDKNANLIYTGALKNDGERLFLLNSGGAVVDEVNCASGWFAGDNENKISMERIDPHVDGSAVTNWSNNNGVVCCGLDAFDNPVRGTPGQCNSVTESSLPVWVTNFAAVETNGRVKLTWHVETEKRDARIHLYKLSLPDTVRSELRSQPFLMRKNSPSEFWDEHISAGHFYDYFLIVRDERQKILFSDSIRIEISYQNESSKNNGLLKLFPNPFNPDIDIHYFVSSAKSSSVSVHIVNILGQHVKTLAVESPGKGWHHVHWNGLDQKGHSVSSGVYICRLLSCGRILEKKRIVKMQ